MRRHYILKIVQTAMMTAILAVLAQIAIPTPWNVPFTLQTFGVALCAYFLGPWYGTASILVYIALGAVGAPVFSGLKGSVGALVGMTGGYIFGFILMVLLCGLVWKTKNIPAIILSSAAGLLLCHLLGAIWFSIVGDLVRAFRRLPSVPSQRRRFRCRRLFSCQKTPKAYPRLKCCRDKIILTQRPTRRIMLLIMFRIPF
mgnify:CR=1 FL=1